jgi:hypothetical protein
MPKNPPTAVMAQMTAVTMIWLELVMAIPLCPLLPSV